MLSQKAAVPRSTATATAALAGTHTSKGGKAAGAGETAGTSGQDKGTPRWPQPGKGAGGAAAPLC